VQYYLHLYYIHISQGWKKNNGFLKLEICFFGFLVFMFFMFFWFLGLGLESQK